MITATSKLTTRKIMITTTSNISRNMITKYDTCIYIYIFTFLVTKAGVVTDITYIDRFVWGRGFAIGDSITKLWFHVSTISICSLWFLTFTPNIWSCMIQFDFHIFYLHLVDFYDRRLAYIRYIYIYMYIPGTFLYQCPKNPRLFPFGVTLWNHPFSKKPQGPCAWAWWNTKPFEGSASCGLQGMGGFSGVSIPGLHHTPSRGKWRNVFVGSLQNGGAFLWFSLGGMSMLYFFWKGNGNGIILPTSNHQF